MGEDPLPAVTENMLACARPIANWMQFNAAMEFAILTKTMWHVQETVDNFATLLMFAERMNSGAFAPKTVMLLVLGPVRYFLELDIAGLENITEPALLIAQIPHHAVMASVNWTNPLEAVRLIVVSTAIMIPYVTLMSKEPLAHQSAIFQEPVDARIWYAAIESILELVLATVTYYPVETISAVYQKIMPLARVTVT